MVPLPTPNKAMNSGVPSMEPLAHGIIISPLDLTSLLTEGEPLLAAEERAARTPKGPALEPC